MRAIIAMIFASFFFTISASAQTISYLSPPSTVGSGLQSAAFTVRLSTTQHGGVFVALASGDTTLALVTTGAQQAGSPSAQVFVPNGSRDATFIVQALEGVVGTVTLTASAPAFANAATDVDVVEPGMRIVGLNTAIDVPDADDPFHVQTGLINAGATALTAIQALRAGGPGLTLTFSVADAAVAELVTTTQAGQTIDLGMLGGQSSTPTTVATGGVAFSPLTAGTTDVSVTAPGFAAVNGGVAAVTVGPALVGYLGFPVEVGAGLRTGTLYVSLNGTAHGGTTVHLVSLDSSLVLLSAAAGDVGRGSLDLFIADGTANASFWAHGLEATAGVAPIDATAASFTGVSEGITVVQPAMDIQGLVANIDTLDPVDPFYVRVGVPNSGGTGLAAIQPVRPGSAGLDVAVISTDAAVGLLQTSSALDDTVTVRIEAGSSQSPTSVATGGVAFDGVGLGTVTVLPEIPGFLPTGNAVRQVTVSQPGIITSGVVATVGAGLQASNTYVQLAAGGHGGVTVRVEVAEPSLALVSGAVDTVGAAVLDIPVANGTSVVYFHLQGLEGQAGVAHLTISAPGFTTAVDSFEVVPPAIQISPGSLLATRTTVDAPDHFHARVGVATSPSVLTPQPLRAGAADLTVTFAVDDPAVARLVTATDSLPTIMLPLRAGASTTPTSVATGGVAFDPLLSGIVTVTVSAPGFQPQTTATQIVTVNPAALTITGGSSVGAGLVSSTFILQLGGGSHGGTTIHVAVSDSSLAVLAPDASTPGEAGIDLLVADGATTATFVLQGLDVVTGPLVVTATAPGFTTAQTASEVVTPALDIINLATALDVTDPDDPFRVRVGLPNAGNSGVAGAQARRPGTAALVAVVACSDPLVGNLVTLGGTGGQEQVLIQPGQSISANTVAQGGIALRGVGTGTTLVAATIAGFTPMGAATVAVDVTQSGIALLGLPPVLGAGLQTIPLVARLTDGNHGGVTMRIAAADPAAVLVSGDPAAVGTDTLAVFMPNGTRDVVFHLQALDSASGTTTVTAAVAGFTPGARPLAVVAPAVAVTLLPDSLDVTDPPDPFVVQVGVPTADLAGLASTQAVRAGGSPPAIAVSLDNGARADLVTAGGAADSVVVTIAPGQFQSAGTVAAGGVAIDGAQAGAVTVSVTAPGYVTVGMSSQVVIIFGELSAVGDLPAVLALEGNHPNPFNPSTTIRFSLGAAGAVTLDIHDVRGRRVRRLVGGEQAAGPHEVRWDGTDDGGRRLAAGVYLVRLQAADGVRTGKMSLVK